MPLDQGIRHQSKGQPAWVTLGQAHHGAVVEDQVHSPRLGQRLWHRWNERCGRRSGDRLAGHFLGQDWGVLDALKTDAPCGVPSSWLPP